MGQLHRSVEADGLPDGLLIIGLDPDLRSGAFLRGDHRRINVVGQTLADMLARLIGEVPTRKCVVCGDSCIS